MMDVTNIETNESDDCLSEDSLEVSDNVVPFTEKSEKISCALCVNRNKGKESMAPLSNRLDH